MLKFRNIVLFASSLGEFFAMNLEAPEAKRAHVESVILLDNNSLTEHDESTDAVFGGTDSNTTIGVDDHSQGFSSNENSTLHDKEISTTTEEESTLSADSIDQQVADILRMIPEIGVRAFEGASDYGVIEKSIEDGAFDSLRYDYYVRNNILDDLSTLLQQSETYRDVLFSFVSNAHCFIYDDKYNNEDIEKIRKIFEDNELVLPLE